MNFKRVSTRRGFFRKAGAVFSAPLAVASAGPPKLPGDESEAFKARLATLEDISAIRELQQSYAKHVNSGAREELRKLFCDTAEAELDETVCGLSSESFGEADVIELAGDRGRATARIHCTVHTETPIGADCTLVQMARLQGEGVLRQSARCVLEHTYVKQHGAWKIERVNYRSG